MQKISTMRTSRKNIFNGKLTIGLDLGDRTSAYCVMNEAEEIVLEHKLATTREAMKQVFGSMLRCRIAMETGTHSPWVSRLLVFNERICLVGSNLGTTGQTGREWLMIDLTYNQFLKLIFSSGREKDLPQAEI
jgi:hypothetical protein